MFDLFLITVLMQQSAWPHISGNLHTHAIGSQSQGPGSSWNSVQLNRKGEAATGAPEIFVFIPSNHKEIWWLRFYMVRSDKKARTFDVDFYMVPTSRIGLSSLYSSSLYVSCSLSHQQQILEPYFIFQWTPWEQSLLFTGIWLKRKHSP